MHWCLLTVNCRNIIEKRYGLSEAVASDQASLLLAGSLILYPIVRGCMSSDYLINAFPVWPAHGSIETRIHRVYLIYRLFILYAALLCLACPAAFVDQHAFASGVVIRNRSRIFYAYVVVPKALLSLTSETSPPSYFSSSHITAQSRFHWTGCS